MAAKREPRKTAGNRMSKVLAEELDEDDFYKTTYGGFDEKEGDNEFDAAKEDSADEVDSDFDISEDDEIVSDQDEDAINREEKKKKKTLSSKAYREPKKAKPDSKETVPDEKKKEKKTEPKKKSVESQATAGTTAQDGPSRKSSRRATAANSYLISMKVKERQIADKKKKETVKKPMVGVRRLTQEELMQEAERTERKNLKSLHNYQRLEASRKKISSKKRTFTEPTIKYLSTTMISADSKNPGKISRNFFIFSEEEGLKKEFHWKKMPRVNKPICPVTNKPARYIDPLTSIPYYDLEAFKLIRQAYALASSKKEKSK